MKPKLDNSITIYLMIAFALFYVGDLVTTYVALSSGNFYETNVLLARTGFIGTLILKTIFFLVMFFYLGTLEAQNKKVECGLILGAVMAIGVFMVFNNFGFFGGGLWT